MKQIKQVIADLLECVGEDPNREGLMDTPARVESSLGELLSGYGQNPKDVLKSFENVDDYHGMVLVRGIEFYSMCEHHLLPFFGKAHIAYYPCHRVIGISKLARVFDLYARRLQLQERLCKQVTSAIDECLEPVGSACIIEATHLCVSSRGIKKQGMSVVTSNFTGMFDEDSVKRVLSLIRG